MTDDYRKRITRKASFFADCPECARAKAAYDKRVEAAAEPEVDADCAACISVGIDFSPTCNGEAMSALGQIQEGAAMSDFTFKRNGNIYGQNAYDVLDDCGNVVGRISGVAGSWHAEGDTTRFNTRLDCARYGLRSVVRPGILATRGIR